MLRPIQLQHYLNMLRPRGISDAELVRGTNIDPFLLEDPAYLIDYGDLEQFLDNMMSLNVDNGLGLDIGQQRRSFHYSVLGYYGISCDTVGEGMFNIWSKYGPAFGLMAGMRILEENANLVKVEILAPYSKESIYRFTVEECLSIILHTGGLAAGVVPPFENLEFAYPKPTYHQRYLEIFKCALLFDAPKTCAVIQKNWLELPFKTRDAELNRICREYLEHIRKITEANSPTIANLRQMLLRSALNMPSLEEAAREFGISCRTLARRLQEQGYSYRELVQEVRRELAENWLRLDQKTAKEISFRLGFKDVAAFRHAFKRWTGQSIGEYSEKIHSRRRILQPR